MELNDFTQKVEEVLIRHKSILDIMSKLQETDARTNRAIAKAVTECGCISINASKQQLSTEVDYSELSKFSSSHLQGELCPRCKEQLMHEIGDHLFYVSALCNTLGLDPSEILGKKHDEIITLGKFSLL